MPNAKLKCCKGVYCKYSLSRESWVVMESLGGAVDKVLDVGPFSEIEADIMKKLILEQRKYEQ